MVRVQAIRRIFCAQNRCPEFSFLNTPNFYSIPALCLGNTTPLPRVWAAESSTQAWSCVLSTQTITLHKTGKVPSNFLARTTIHNQAGTHLPLQDGTSLTHQTTTYNFFPDKATSPSASTNTRQFKILLGHLEILDFFRCPILLQPLFRITSVITCGDELLVSAHSQQRSKDQTDC